MREESGPLLGSLEETPQKESRYSRVVLAALFGVGLIAVAATAWRSHSSTSLLQEQDLQSGAPVVSKWISDGSGEAQCVSKNSPVLSGYDVVAYFSLDEGADGVQGTEEFTATYQEYTFYFSSQDNLNQFEANPSKYAPQWGGFCAYGISSESFWTLQA